MRSVVFFCVASVCDALLASIRPAKYGKALQFFDGMGCTASSTSLEVRYGFCTCAGWVGLNNELLAAPTTAFEESVGCINKAITCQSTPATANSCKPENEVAIAAITSCTSTIADATTYYFPGMICVWDPSGDQATFPSPVEQGPPVQPFVLPGPDYGLPPTIDIPPIEIPPITMSPTPTTTPIPTTTR
jgi:hypothetical protein